MRLLRITILLLLAVLPAVSRAQYYQTGQTPARQRWMQIESDSLRMIFPREFEAGARRTMFYMDAVRPYINYGLTHAPLRSPVVFKTENFYSNGLAMMAPRRMELVSIPAADSYSEPWLKQIAVHEYRHMVQYGNMNRNTVKFLSYLGGEQISLLATGVLPFWFIEGDAVMAETQMSAFGRGLQPSFNMHYRALGREILEGRNPDKWFAGSYRDYVPSHYELGYRLVEYSQKKYGKYIWDDIISYSSKYPFLLFTTQLGLGKYYDTSTRELFRETFYALNDYWDSLPQVEDSAVPVVEEPASYTTYSHPLFIDGNTIVALKTDYHRTQRFIAIDIRTGAESHIAYTGQLSSRPDYRDGRLWWTEYRQSPLWEQKTDSRIYFMDLQAGDGQLSGSDDSGSGAHHAKRSVSDIPHSRPRRFGDHAQALYPTATDDGLAFVRYHYDGHYSIEWNSGKLPDESVPYESVVFDSAISIHGLIFDDKSGLLYFIALDNSGMWIGGVDINQSRSEVRQITAPAKITLSDLRAGGGKLYFGSIASGKDEAHAIDLQTGVQYRLTESNFGSFSPAPSPDGNLVALTVYGRNGYRPAVQQADYSNEVVLEYLPANVVNPEPVRWDVPKMDDMVFSGADLAESQSERPARRFRQLPHIFNIHSWAPIYFEPDNTINSTDFNIHAGATLISQSLLGDAVSSLGYGYTTEGNSLVRGRINYLGSVPKFDIEATWSNSGQIVSAPESATAPERLKDYIEVSANAYLPILLSSGHNVRWLTPSIQYLYRNSLLWDSAAKKYIEGEGFLAGMLSYSHSTGAARLDLQPRWGYALRMTVIGRPFDERFMTTWSLYGRAYLPGIVRHHGLTIAVSYMGTAGEGSFGYPLFDVLPHGFTANFMPAKYFGASVNYRLPIAYPDFGISGVVFLKRIWMTLGTDFGRYPGERQDPRLPLLESGTNIWSYGGSLNFDFVPFRLPSQGTCTLTISCWKPSNATRPLISAGFSVPL